MQVYRRLLLVAILAWSASATAARAENDGSGDPCNALCRFWLGRDDRPKEAAAPPVVAAEAPRPIEAVPQDRELEAPPIVRMKRTPALRTRRAANGRSAVQPPDAAVEDGQGGTAGVPAATASQPMDLTPEEAAAIPEVRPAPVPPRRPTPRVRQARSRRPAALPKGELPVSLSIAEPQPGAAQSARSASAKPATAPTVPLPNQSPTMAASPPGRPAIAMSGVQGDALARPAPASPILLRSSLDAGSTAVGRTVPAVDARHLHDVAPGPRPALTADSTGTTPVAAKRPETTDPDEALEKLKETILRSAQEALKQSDVHGF